MYLSLGLLIKLLPDNFDGAHRRRSTRRWGLARPTDKDAKKVDIIIQTHNRRTKMHSKQPSIKWYVNHIRIGSGMAWERGVGWVVGLVTPAGRRRLFAWVVWFAVRKRKKKKNERTAETETVLKCVCVGCVACFDFCSAVFKGRLL